MSVAISWANKKQLAKCVYMVGFPISSHNYYKSLYWMVIVVMILVMIGFWKIKLITLITVSNNCGCKCCICLCSTFKHSLTKLWYIAIIYKRHNECSEQNGNCQPTTGEWSAMQPLEGSQPPEGSQLREGSRPLEGSWPLEDSQQLDGSQPQEGRQPQEEGSRPQEGRRMEAYKILLKKDIPNNVVEDLRYYNNFCRSIIPYILLSSLVAILCLICLSFDLHPLACITEFEEDLIAYDPELNRVEIKFSNHLLILQKVAAFLVIFLLITYTACVILFFCCTENVIEELKDKVEKELSQQLNLSLR